jgi:hypothetical protein
MGDLPKDKGQNMQACTRRNALKGFLSLASPCLVSSNTQAQNWPNRPVRISQNNCYPNIWLRLVGTPRFLSVILCPLIS